MPSLALSGHRLPLNLRDGLAPDARRLSINVGVDPHAGGGETPIVFPAIGNVVPLNLSEALASDPHRLVINLGVSDSEPPVDPPEPVIRGIRASASLPWQAADALRGRSLVASWTLAPRRLRAATLPWDTSPLQRRAVRLAWGTSPLNRHSTALPWRSMLPRKSRAQTMPWKALDTQRATTQVAWLARLLLQYAAARMPWRAPGLTQASRGMAWLGRMPSARRSLLAAWRHPGLERRTWRLPWGYAALVPWIVRPPKPPPPPPPTDNPFPPGNLVGLNLGCPIVDVPGYAPLNLGVTACYAVRPNRRTYIVLNDVAVVRLPDRLPIEVDSISISHGVDAWGASFDLSLCDPRQLPMLTPNAQGPRQVEITLNGYVWTAIIESFTSRREFVAGGVTIAGRSRTALLAAPYAPARTKVTTEVRTAQQLVDEELQNTGYTAAYATTDWLVPAGAWYYDNTTALDAISRIAEASGGVVQSDPQDLTLRVRPRYPVSPWLWTDSTPDVTLFDDIVTGLNLQVRSVPLYDAVVVTGEIAGKGVTARVRREGEAGTLYAAQASSQLVNTAAVATERGRNILSDRGEQASIDLTLPLFAAPVLTGQTGRVLPLDLVEVRESGETWHGLCTANRIEVRVDGGAWVIEQTVTLERHYSDAD